MTSQSAFRAALFDADLPAPPGLTGPAGRPVGNRFNVYRNNVVVSLTEALQSSFPVVQKLVGHEFFTAMAGLFIRQNPPSSPLLMFYGEAMPAFLVSFPPAQAFGYLPDIARLELALRQSYHAADAQPITAAELSAVPPQALPALRLTLTPATRLIRSHWPIHAIWRFNSVEHAPKPVMQAEDALILRPAFDPVPHLLPLGGAALLSALAEGMPLAEAAESANPQPDIAALLALLLQGGGIGSLTTKTA